MYGSSWASCLHGKSKAEWLSGSACLHRAIEDQNGTYGSPLFGNVGTIVALQGRSTVATLLDVPTLLDRQHSLDPQKVDNKT